METKLNWSELCRACLKKANAMESLLTDSPETENIYKMYAALTNIQLDVTETSPSQFCQSCKVKLVESFNFRKMCLESEEHFRNYKQAMESESQEQSCESNSQQNVDEYVGDDSEVQATNSVEFPLQEVLKELERIKSRFETLKRCVICPDIYSYDLPNKGLILHMVHAHRNVHNWCSNCNLLINGDFNEHKESHQKDNGKCKFCGRLYKNINRLFPHLKSHIAPSLVCNICEKAFLKKDFRNFHMLMHEQYEHASSFDGDSGNDLGVTEAEMVSNIDHAYVKQDPESVGVDQPELIIKCDESDDSEVIIIYNPYSAEGDNNEINQFGITNTNTEGANLDHSLAVDIWKAIQDAQLNRNPHTACIFCSEKADNHRDLVEHVKNEHSDVQNWCSSCNELIKKNYANHMNEHDEEEIECQFCQDFINQNEYLKHLGEHFGSVMKSVVPDEACKDVAGNYENEVNVKPHLCSTCGKAFLYKSSLKRHTINVHKSKNKRNTVKFKETKLCKECNEYVENLEQHLLEHSGEETEGVLCDLCGDVFKLKTSLKKHILEVHGCNREQPAYKCTFCGKEFQTKRQIDLHKKLHLLERTHICNICGKGFKTNGNLNNHIATHERKFVCKVCQKRYGTRSELRIHLMKHTGEKPFLCSECGAGFTQHCHLVDHSRTHTGELPFECLQCGRAFKRKHTMKIHIMSHSGLKTLTCPYCTYACNRRYHLKMHMKTHLKVRTKREPDEEEVSEKISNVKFICRICEKRFFSKSSLQVHMSSAHNVMFQE